jgi:hypothetical protein
MFNPEESPIERDPIRVLVATDVLSEGQNLQDARIVVNYDLPWAIIKLIQRAGRVDRVGQKASEVLVYSMFHNGLNPILDLRQRIRGRLEAAAKAFGSDEQFFGTQDEVKVLQNVFEGNELLELDDPMGVDAASAAYEVWNSATNANPALAKRIESLPDLVHSTKAGPSPAGMSDGLSSFVQTENGLSAYGHAPGSGEPRLISAQEILAFFKCEPETPIVLDRADHDDLLAQLVQGKEAPLAVAQVRSAALQGVRKRVFYKLTESLHDVNDVNLALDALHQYPLTEEAEKSLKKALAKHDLEHLASVVTHLHREDRLVRKAVDDDAIRIVCTMGVTK